MVTDPRVWLSLSMAVGCSPEPIAVTVAPGEAPTFRWEGGNAHDVLVYRCQSDCEQTECGRVVPFAGGGAVVWQVGVLDEDASSAPPIASPVTYGDLEVPGDEKAWEATPLESGGVYAVEVFRYDACSGGQDGCTRFQAKGCEVFEQP
jgi:hypothetical protein